MSRLHLICGLHLVALCLTIAQEARLAAADSIDDEIRLAQSGEAEDSPLAELLDAEPAAATFVEVRSRFIARTETSEGYWNGTYRGSRLKSYQRIRIAPVAHLSGGLLIEKDPGERRLNDFTTGYVALKGIGPFRMMLVGDFIVESGLGLSLWRGADMGKGEDIAGAVVRKERGIVPHLSSDENSYFRGAALGLQLGRWSLNFIYSSRRVDATVDRSGDVTGISLGGYFRTASEEAKRGVFIERLYGGTAHFQVAVGGTFGVCVYRSNYTRTLRFDEGKRFSGQSAALMSCDYRWKTGVWSLFGEWGVANHTTGGSSGARLQPAPGIDIIAAMRWYPYRFVSLHGNGFGEHAGMSNEKGIYAGLRVVTTGRWSVAGYADLFRFPGGTSSQHFASGGSDWFLQAELQPADRWAITVRYVSKEAIEEQLTRGAQGLFTSASTQALRRSVRINADFRTVGGVKVRGRWERALVSQDRSGSTGHGMLVLAELSAPSSARLWWHLRTVVFRTTSYEARIYAYERDLDGVTTIPALYGEGLRWSCVVRYSFSRAFSCSLKYSEEVRDDVKRIGTGPDRLPENKDGMLGVQLDLAL